MVRAKESVGTSHSAISCVLLNLRSEMNRTAENHQFRQGGSLGLADIATAVGQAVQTAISKANPQSSGRQSLVDTNGLGKPPTNVQQRICEIHRGSAIQPVVEWVEDQDLWYHKRTLEQQFGPLGERSSGRERTSPRDESENFDIVLSGLETLRCLVRRWDPLSGGKLRALLRQILVLDRCKLQDLLAGLGTGSPIQKEQIERND